MTAYYDASEGRHNRLCCRQGMPEIVRVVPMLLTPCEFAFGESRASVEHRSVFSVRELFEGCSASGAFRGP